MDIQNALSQLVALDLTQNYIASEIDCSQSSVSEMLNGKVGTKRPSYITVTALIRLCKKHRIKLSDTPAKGK